MIKRYLFVFLAAFWIISICSAEVQTLGTFKQGQIINLIQSCENSTYSNITRVLYPNSSTAINGQYNMTRTGDDYSYHFYQSEQLGQYLVYGSCDENGLYTKWVYDFYTTPSGAENVDSGTSLVLFGSLAIILIISITFIILGFKIENLAGRITLLVLGFIGLLMSVLFNMVSVSQYLAANQNITSSFETFLTVIKVLASLGFTIFLIIVVMIMIKSWKIKRGYVD
jgi:hypothetical protein